jgi:hypothetical protein
MPKHPECRLDFRVRRDPAAIAFINRLQFFRRRMVFACTPRLYFARVLRKLSLILFWPGFGLLDYVSKDFCDHESGYTISRRRRGKVHRL